MKIAISGKGGAGKTTLATALALLMASKGKKVLALDADPVANFATSLGISSEIRGKIIPISKQKALIEERTGAKVNQFGQMFKLNPEVSDIADRYAVIHEGIALIVIGAIEKGGSGCACPESVLVKALVSNLVLNRNEAFIMDMEAGVEHLGRATARGVDCILIVVEPGQKSIECAKTIRRMAKDIGLRKIHVVANKVSCAEDLAFIKKSLDGFEFIGSIPYSEKIKRSDIIGHSVLENTEPETLKSFESILNKLEAMLK